MAGPTRSPIHLLIVDDDTDLRGLLVPRFQRVGMTAPEAASGEQSLPKLSAGRCDVAILDLHLPGMTGIDLLAKVKELSPETEVLLLTAHSSIETAVQAMKS